MNDINLLIKDAFDIISLILVFAFVLFDIRYPQINKELDKVIPPGERRQERARLAKDLRQSLLVGAVPLVVIYAVLLYLFSPLFITAVTNANLQLWRFDFMLTAFILVYIFIFVFLIWSVYLAVRLISRIREIHRP
jgi:sterol desaturase/sphingolipid hydroxylase (fatty acid hydroxylase superfamily)